MAQGTLKWFNNDKGYGFIIPDEGTEELFVHRSGIVVEGFKTIKEGAKVTYETTRGRKGMQAVNVSELSNTRRRRKGVRRAEMSTRAASAPIPEERAPGFKPGDDVLFTEAHYLAGRQATVLAASEREVTIRTSILRGKGVLYRNNAVLAVRPEQIRRMPR